MTLNIEPEREEDDVLRDSDQATWFGSAVAISVLVVATITLTLVAGGIDLALFP
jgi:hypothetical protein